MSLQKVLKVEEFPSYSILKHQEGKAKTFSGFNLADIRDIIEALQFDLLSSVIDLPQTVFISPVITWDGKEYDPEEDLRRINERNLKRDEQLERQKKMMFE